MFIYAWIRHFFRGYEVVFAYEYLNVAEINYCQPTLGASLLNIESVPVSEGVVVVGVASTFSLPQDLALWIWGDNFMASAPLRINMALATPEKPRAVSTQ